jgi:hypothetical protein
MNAVYIRLFKIFYGPPDLTVRVLPAKSWIYGGPIPGVPQDSSLVTVTVQNRFSLPPSFPGPVAVEEPDTLSVFGSDARGVLVSIGLTNGLEQVGGLSLAPGFQAAIAPDKKSMFFYGGTVLAGASVDFQFEVIGPYGCDYKGSILAEVDPYSFISEADKTNNKGNATIAVSSIC